MIVGILPNASTAEILLNNLSEADFDLSDVSVIMQDLKLRDSIAQDGGPLQGVDLSNLSARLVQAGLSAQDANLYRDALAQGKVLVALAAPSGSEQAAKEMFHDHSAQLIQG